MKQERNNEIDLLLRRLGRRDGAPLSEVDGQHLDADELNSYVANALPQAARARYTEHLADCGSCRKLVAQLSASEGAITAPQTVAVSEPSGWKKFLAGLFSPMVLRYAVPALGVIVIMVVGFVVLRRERASDFVAEIRQQEAKSPAAEPALVQAPSAGVVADNSSPSKTASPQINAQRTEEVATKATSAADKNDAQPTPQPQAAKPEAPAVGQQQPVATEPPPAPKVATTDAEAQSREESEKKRPAKLADQTAAGGDATKQRTEEAAKEEQRKLNAISAAAPSTGSRAKVSELRRAQRTDTAGSGTYSAAEDTKEKDAVAETRSVAGRRFRKRGGIWIDTAYDSSRATTNLARGSEQYRALVADEPPIRTIADQLDGEIIVVWKGRAYRIR
jgi:hypothetical protein